MNKTESILKSPLVGSVPSDSRNAPEDNTRSYQVDGDHYAGAIQPIDFIVQNNIPYREANVIKYVFRHRRKNGLVDLEKARHYIDMLIEEYKS